MSRFLLFVLGKCIGFGREKQIVLKDIINRTTERTVRSDRM